MMRYIAAFLIVMGLGMMTGAGSHDWLPMVLAQGALGVATLIAGGLFVAEAEGETEND